MEKPFPIENLAAGDTVELTTGPDQGMRGLVDAFDTETAWIMFASDGEDTRKIALNDLKITHKATFSKDRGVRTRNYL